MHALAKRIAEWLVDRSDYPFNQEEIRYGIEVFLGTVFQIIIILLVAFVIGLAKEVAFCLLSAAIYRRFSGGAHCEKYYRCTVTSLLVFNVLAYIAHLIDPAYFQLFVLIAFITSLLALLFLVPVDNPRNPISNTEQRKILKLKASMVLVVLFGGSFGAYRLNAPQIALAILLGVLWQTFTLTALGHKFIVGWDRSFAYIETIFSKEGGIHNE